MVFCNKGGVKIFVFKFYWSLWICGVKDLHTRNPKISKEKSNFMLEIFRITNYEFSFSPFNILVNKYLRTFVTIQRKTYTILIKHTRNLMRVNKFN